MATRVETPTLVVPAGTPIAAPVSALLFAQRAEIEEIEVKVPPGPSGLVGFRFDHSSRQVIPAVDGTWIITDDETLNWPLHSYSVNPDWRIRAYNLGAFDHTLYIRVLLNDTRLTVPSAITLVPVE